MEHIESNYDYVKVLDEGGRGAGAVVNQYDSIVPFNSQLNAAQLILSRVVGGVRGRTRSVIVSCGAFGR